MVTVERAGVKDHGLVAGLVDDMSSEGFWQREPDRDRWDRILAELLNSDGWLFLLAFDDGEPVGLATVSFAFSIRCSSEEARLVILYVEPGARLRGTGTLLMNGCLAASRRRGCRLMELELDPEKCPAAEFFEHFDYDSENRLLTWNLKNDSVGHLNSGQ